MDVVTVAQAARILRRHPEVIRDWLRQKKLRGKRFGMLWLIERTELERFKRDEPERRKRRT